MKIDKYSKNYDIAVADIAIEFSTPDSAFDNIKQALLKKIPVVAGTTGWLSQYDQAVRICNENQTGFLYASNFSVGVTIFFELNKFLAKMMSNLSEYKVSIEESHHVEKLDAPSGTAITLAEGIIEQTNKKGWQLGNKVSEDEIPITAHRIGNTPGMHTITYQSEVDTIEIKHTAHNRLGFALGAVLAAEWLLNKKGVFSMKDVLLP